MHIIRYWYIKIIISNYYAAAYLPVCGDCLTELLQVACSMQTIQPSLSDSSVFYIYVWDKCYQKTVKVVMLLVFVTSNISFSLFDDNQKHHTEKINGLPNLPMMRAARTGCAPPVLHQPRKVEVMASIIGYRTIPHLTMYN